MKSAIATISVAAFSQPNAPQAINLHPSGPPTERSRAGRSRSPAVGPLASPAIADVKIFVGGGFGSHEFYAFDGETGQLLCRRCSCSNVRL
jgi:hypothetical protein